MRQVFAVAVVVHGKATKQNQGLWFVDMGSVDFVWQLCHLYHFVSSLAPVPVSIIIRCCIHLWLRTYCFISILSVCYVPVWSGPFIEDSMKV
jgi:hypothetical protein